MALLAEEIVEEWLNRKGYFTIRGIKIGVQEIDLLAVKLTEGKTECRHVEVQASIHAVSYVTGVAKAIQKQYGRAAYSAKERTAEELGNSVNEWIQKKFLMKRKQAIRERIAPGAKWTYELVVNDVKHPEELDVIRNSGVIVHSLSDIIVDIQNNEGIVPAASGSHFVELVLLKKQ